jgi:hypothetical protein
MHAHRARHEAEVLRRADHAQAGDLALGDQHRLVLAGDPARLAQPVGVALLVAEAERVDERRRHRHLHEHAAVEQRLGTARAG